MSEFGWEPDKMIRYQAAAHALVNHEGFGNLLEDLATGMISELTGDSIAAIRRGDAHMSLTTASEAKGIEDFLSRLKSLDPSSTRPKTSAAQR